MVGLPLLMVLALGGPRGEAVSDARGGARPQEQRPTFRAGVDVVEVDVLAFDASGQPVTDLRQDEFAVFEDGHRCELASFLAINRPLLPPHPVISTDVATNAAADEGRLFFLVLDDVHTLKEVTASVQATARRLLERLSPGDHVAVAWISQGTKGAREFTANHAEVLSAIDAVEGQATRVGRRNPVEMGLPDAQRPTLLERSDPDSAHHDGFAPDLTGGLSREDVKAIFDKVRPFSMLKDVCEYAASLPHRRKTVVYIGDGPGLLFFEKPQYFGDTSGDRHYLDIVRAIAAARRANVAFYVLSPSRTLLPVVDGRDHGERRLREIVEGQEALSVISSATGGFATRGPTIIDSVDRVMRESSAYYLLGYYTEPPKATSDLASLMKKGLWTTYRSIEVKTTRPGVTLVARKGYWPVAAASAREKEKAASTPLVGAVRGLLPSSALALRAQAVPLRGSTGSPHDVAIVVEVPAPERDLLDTSPPRDEVELLMVAAEPGKGERTHESVKTGLTLRDGGGGSRYLLGALLKLPPGQYQLRLGVRSALTNRTGSVYVDVAVPDFDRTEASLGGLVLERASGPRMPMAASKAFAAALPLIPTLDREFAASDTVRVTARVYRRDASASVKVTAAVTRLADNHEVWRTGQDLTPAGSSPHECRFVLPLSQLAPGGYRLTVSTGSERRLLDFSVTGR